MATEATLASIDATVDGLCACGCGRKLSDSSRSGWWATEKCQKLWQLAQVRPNEAEQRQLARQRAERRRLRQSFASAGYYMSEEDAQRVAEQIQRGMAEMSEAMRRFGEQLAVVFDEIGRQLAPLMEEMERAEVLEQEPPTDPRERALWLRRNRNTGPQRHRQWSVRRLARESRRAPR